MELPHADVLRNLDNKRTNLEYYRLMTRIGLMIRNINTIIIDTIANKKNKFKIIVSHSDIYDTDVLEKVKLELESKDYGVEIKYKDNYKQDDEIIITW